MKNLAIVVIILFTLIFVACATTVKDLKENPAGEIIFQTDKNYITVYRKSTTYLRNRGNLKSDLYTNNKSGIAYIQQSSPGPFGIIWLAVELKAKNQNSTFVHIYYAANTWQEQAYKLKKQITKN